MHRGTKNYRVAVIAPLTAPKRQMAFDAARQAVAELTEIIGLATR